jgi:hypothetical protein
VASKRGALYLPDVELLLAHLQSASQAAADHFGVAAEAGAAAVEDLTRFPAVLGEGFLPRADRACMYPSGPWYSGSKSVGSRSRSSGRM